MLPLSCSPPSARRVARARPAPRCARHRCRAGRRGIRGARRRAPTRNYVVEELARRDDRTAAGDAWNILTELMRGSFRLMIVVGLLFLLAAWLAGPGRRALTVRGWLAPAASGHTARSRSSRSLLLRRNGRRLQPLVVIILAALGATWIELTRRQTLHEFPDAQGTAFFADTWGRVSGWWKEQLAATKQSTGSAIAQLPRPTSRRACRHSPICTPSGALTDEEYASAKAASSPKADRGRLSAVRAETSGVDSDVLRASSPPRSGSWSWSCSACS